MGVTNTERVRFPLVNASTGEATKERIGPENPLGSLHYMIIRFQLTD